MRLLKKIQFVTLNNGVGGSEKAVATLADSLTSLYDVEIISLYDFSDSAYFEVNKDIRCCTLIPRVKRMTRIFKLLLDDFDLKKIFQVIREDYITCGKVLYLIPDIMRVINMRLIRKRRVLKNFFLRSDADIVITTSATLNKYLVKYAPKNVKKIGWVHDKRYLTGNIKNKELRIWEQLDRVVFVTPALLGKYQNEFKKNNGVFIPDALSEVPDITSELDKLRVIAIGKLEVERGLLEYIDVINYVHKVSKDIEFLIVGDGFARNQIESKIVQYRLEKCIKMLGEIPHNDLVKILGSCSVFVSPSISGSLGLSVLEALSVGLPCVVFENSLGGTTLIKNEVNGILVEDGNYHMMADKVIELIDDETFRKTLGNCAKETSLSYDIKAIKGEWLKIL